MNIFTKYIYIFPVLLFLGFLSGCSSVDKGLKPIDKGIYNIKKAYNSAANSTSEAINSMANSVDDMGSSFNETSFVKFLSDDKTILATRNRNFVRWNGSSDYDSGTIIRDFLRKNKIYDIKERNLKISQKMNILKNHFFDQLKQEHINKFKKKHKKVTFDKFLTDRENIQKIYEYKMNLAESEHDWNMCLHDTKKKVAELMFAALYKTPSLKFISYDPYEEEIYLEVVSKKNEFKEKIKFEASKKIAREITNRIKIIKPSVYFTFNNDNLELVGVAVIYKKKVYICELVDNAYVRQSDVVFISSDISLKDEDVNYSEVIKNIIPPKWFYTIQESNSKIAYGQGQDSDEAKADAYNNIAQTIKVTVSSNFSSKEKINGSIHATNSESENKQKVDKVDIKNSNILKLEKKDGIWFVAIGYNI